MTRPIDSENARYWWSPRLGPAAGGLGALQDGKGYFSAIIGPDGASTTVQRSNELLALKHTYVRCAVLRCARTEAGSSRICLHRDYMHRSCRRRTGVGCVKQLAARAPGLRTRTTQAPASARTDSQHGVRCVGG